MNTENRDKAERLLTCFSEIDDDLIEEAEIADTIAQKVGRKRLIKYGAVTAGISGVAAAIYFLLRVWMGKRSSVTF